MIHANGSDDHEGEDGDVESPVVSRTHEDDRADSDPPLRTVCASVLVTEVEDPDAHEGEDGPAHSTLAHFGASEDRCDSDPGFKS